MKRFSDPEGLAKQLAGLSALPRTGLKEEWVRLYATPVPIRAGRKFLISAIAYKIQEQALGGLRPETKRLLHRIAAEVGEGRKTSLEASPNRQGTVLLREWRGVTHQVEILERGVRYRDKHYRSLSEVAKVITGSHWSGPAFFGLKKRHG